MLVIDGIWHFVEVLSRGFVLCRGFHCTAQMADSVYGVGEWFADVNVINWPIVSVGLLYGQAYVMDKEHRCMFFYGFLNA